MVLHWIRERITERRSHPCVVDRSLVGNIMRVDAEAEGTKFAIGGWLPVRREDGSCNEVASKWF